MGSGKGGTGQSTLCVGLGAALAAAGHQVVLVDLQRGPALARLCRIDVAPVGEVPPSQRITTTEHAGLGLLHAPERADDLPALATELGQQGVDILLVDAPRSLDDRLPLVLAAADSCLLVTTPEPVAIDGLYRLLREVLEQLSDTDCRLHLLCNDIRRTEELPLLPQIEEVVREGLEIDLRVLEAIPHDPQLWIASRRTGGPLAAGPSSALGPALQRVAADLEPLGA